MGGDRGPVEALAGLAQSVFAAPLPLARLGGGLDEGGRERVLVVGGHEPAAFTVVDDLRRPV